MKYDYENVLEYAVEQATEKGFSEGEAKGRAEGVASVISKLLKSGFAADAIASATGLSITDIQKYCQS
jgi:predicted transposase/invertase (TIGR01784 family)